MHAFTENSSGGTNSRSNDSTDDAAVALISRAELQLAGPPRPCSAGVQQHPHASASPHLASHPAAPRATLQSEHSAARNAA